MMNRTTRLDGTFEQNEGYKPIKFVHDPKGLTIEELLKLREQQNMTNAAIARTVNSKVYYSWRS